MVLYIHTRAASVIDRSVRPAIPLIYVYNKPGNLKEGRDIHHHKCVKWPCSEAQDSDTSRMR